jgi:1,4-dihydroxy-2-naphthoate octaprenyltransferase
MKRSTLLHLRIPFSFFLLPIFLLGSAIVQDFEWWRFALIFFILHVLLYPASNGYNSYFDKDEKSIGGLKNPPKVSKELYNVALIFDLIALVLGLLISYWFVLFLFVYGLVSKAYSHPAVRLKKYPLLGWIAAGVFQGYFTVLMLALGLSEEGIQVIFQLKVQFAAILSTLLLFGSYPMTQVYQHEEDAARGDRTISLILGIAGTFHFTGLFFGFSVSMFIWFFLTFYSLTEGLIFGLALSPVLVFFSLWYLKMRKDPSKADFENTMRLNLISAICLNGFFAWLMFV